MTQKLYLTDIPCDPPTCEDGKENQGEENIDCGGPCPMPCDATYRVQIRGRFMAPVGYFEDVCVDNKCYTSGPAEGNYRRDAADSALVLTDAAGWHTTRGGWFTVDQFERDMLIYYMDSETVGEVSKDDFLANPSAYYNDGSSSMFSRTHLKDMAQIVGGW